MNNPPLKTDAADSPSVGLNVLYVARAARNETRVTNEVTGEARGRRGEARS